MKNLGVSMPVAGAGVALAAGLLLGAAMRPQLAIGELAPQPVDAWPQELSPAEIGAPDALAFAQYGGQLPDYVLGLDWLAATAPAAEPPAPEATEPVASDAAPIAPPSDETAPAAPAHATPAAAQTPTTSAAAQDQSAPDDAVAAPPAIPTLAIEEPAAPPEATGDTTRPEH